MFWQTKKLGDKNYFEILGSGIDKFEGEKSYLSTSSIEKNIIKTPEGKITYQERPSRANMQPRLNSVWFARMKDTIKVYSFTKENKDEINKYILSTGFAGVLCNTNKVLPKYVEKIFLSKWFNGFKNALASDKAIQKSLNNEDIINIKIPLPPLPEQQKIVYILDSIQDAIRTQEKIIEKTKELKKSLLNEIFNSKIKSQKSKFKIKRWEKLGNLCEKPEYGYTANSIKKSLGPKFLRITDIQDEKVNWENVPFCECKEVGKYLLNDRDILIARIGATTGKTFLIKNPPRAIFGSYLIRIKTKPKLFSDFLNYYFQSSHYWRQINQLKGGKLKGGLNIPILQGLRVPLPPLPEQREIAEILQTIDQKIEIEQKKKALYEELFRTMLNKLMTGEIRVDNLKL